MFYNFDRVFSTNLWFPICFFSTNSIGNLHFIWHFHTSFKIPYQLLSLDFHRIYMGFSTTLYLFHKIHRVFTRFNGYTSSSCSINQRNFHWYLRCSTIFKEFSHIFLEIFPCFSSWTVPKKPRSKASLEAKRHLGPALRLSLPCRAGRFDESGRFARGADSGGG